MNFEKLLFGEESSFIARDGKKFEIRSDHKTILRIISFLEKGGALRDALKIFFKSDIPEKGAELMTEFIGSEYLPSPDNVFSFIGDGAYIIGAFLQCYGLDITGADIHWHKFAALFTALPCDTAFSQIIKCRCGNFDDPVLRMKAKRIGMKNFKR